MGTFRKQHGTILKLNTNVLKLITLHSNLDNHKFKISKINLRFNAVLKIKIVLLSFKVRSNEFQMVVVLLYNVLWPVAVLNRGMFDC